GPNARTRGGAPGTSPATSSDTAIDVAAASEPASAGAPIVRTMSRPVPAADVPATGARAPSVASSDLARVVTAVVKRSDVTIGCHRHGPAMRKASRLQLEFGR